MWRLERCRSAVLRIGKRRLRCQMELAISSHVSRSQYPLRFSSTVPSLAQSTPILIVGGGPTGLMFANLFKLFGTPFLLLEGQSTERRFDHPQAHFLNTRTMEILRHALPSVYDTVRQAMPPVEEWNSFQFGPSMQNGIHSNVMAKVVHPVDRPLRAGADANGVLLDGVTDSKSASQAMSDRNRDLSDCSVGHLAQHTFCRILYDAATQNLDDDTQRIDYGKYVQHIEKATLPQSDSWVHSNDSDKGGATMTTVNNDSDSTSSSSQSAGWKVTTACGQAIFCKSIIACDGANSQLRSKLGISMRGTAEIQRLVNVHFRIEEDDSMIPPSMLYTVFSAEVLAMVVRHGNGDYVMQIPYFHPYQNLKDDFTEDKVRGMVKAAVGNDIAFQIQSIREWTMGSLVAETYYHSGGAGHTSTDRTDEMDGAVAFLAGDAAHVFPPAGGFGMNTGLQDAFALAWKLALQQSPAGIHEIAKSYQQERQPVARNNAALSVRNYNRVLGVTKSCYLDEKHPAVLLAALDGPMSFVPFEYRRQTFLTLLRTAMAPLSNLTNPNNPFTKHVTGNLRRLLGSGQGLPLLFPESELGFRYSTTEAGRANDAETTNSQSGVISSTSWENDSVGGHHRLEEGFLFPHVWAKMESGSTARSTWMSGTSIQGLDRDQSDAGENDSKLVNTVSTRDLPSQIRSMRSPVNFVLLEIAFDPGSKASDGHNLLELAEHIRREIKLPCETVRMTIGDANDGSGDGDDDDEDSGCLHLAVNAAAWEALDVVVPSNPSPAASTTAPRSPLLVAIRPDGHVLSITSNDSDGVERLKDKMVQYRYR